MTHFVTHKRTSIEIEEIAIVLNFNVCHLLSSSHGQSKCTRIRWWEASKKWTIVASFKEQLFSLNARNSLMEPSARERCQDLWAKMLIKCRNSQRMSSWELLTGHSHEFNKYFLFTVNHEKFNHSEWHFESERESFWDDGVKLVCLWALHEMHIKRY